MAQAHHADILTKDSHKRQLLLGPRVAALAPTAALRAQTHDVSLPRFLSVVAASAPQSCVTVQAPLYAPVPHTAMLLSKRMFTQLTAIAVLGPAIASSMWLGSAVFALSCPWSTCGNGHVCSHVSSRNSFYAGRGRLLVLIHGRPGDHVGHATLLARWPAPRPRVRTPLRFCSPQRGTRAWNKLHAGKRVLHVPGRNAQPS